MAEWSASEWLLFGWMTGLLQFGLLAIEVCVIWLVMWVVDQ